MTTPRNEDLEAIGGSLSSLELICSNFSHHLNALIPKYFTKLSLGFRLENFNSHSVCPSACSVDDGGLP